MPGLIPLLALGFALAAAVVIDCRSRRIPNVLSVALCLAGLAGGAVLHGMAGLGASLAGLAAGFAAFFPFWLLGGFGAGDVKLMAAVGAVLGWPLIVPAVAWTLVIGAGMGLAYALWHLAREQRSLGAAAAVMVQSPRAALAVARVRFPYALAIAAGVASTLLVAP